MFNLKLSQISQILAADFVGDGDLEEMICVLLLPDFFSLEKLLFALLINFN